MTSEGQVYTSKKFAPPFGLITEQLCPVLMNCEQTLTTVATDCDFIVSNSVNGVPTGMIGTDITKLRKAFLLLIGRAVNSFAGQNNLDCTVVTDNQWQINIDGGAYADLQNNGKADGQMLDTDWECYGQGIIHPFTFMFDITDMLTALTNRIGLRLANGRARQNNLIVTVDVYMKTVWRL